MEKRLHSIIDINPKSMLYVVAIGFIVFGLWYLRDIFLLVAVALLISLLVEAAVTKLEKIKIPRILGVVLVYIFGIGAVSALLYFLIPIFIEELLSIASLFPNNDLLTSVSTLFENGGAIKDSLSHSKTPIAAINTIRSSFTASGIVSALGSVMGGIVNLFLLVILSFYFAIQKNSIDQFLIILAPRKYEARIADIWRRSKERIMAWFRGQLLSASILAIATYIGLLIMGIPYALLLSLTALLFSLIPYGILLATIPAVVVATLGGGATLGLLVMGYYAILQQLENYVLQPLIMKTVTGVPSLIVLLSAVIAVKLMGFFGLVLALPICIIVIECLNEYERHQLLRLERQDHRPVGTIS